jgi:hypothetical protein
MDAIQHLLLGEEDSWVRACACVHVCKKARVGYRVFVSLAVSVTTVPHEWFS